jgi:uncharacterized repeat protein (TIGR01451 family)
VSGHFGTAPSARNSKQAWSLHRGMRRARGAVRFLVGGVVAGVMAVPGIVLLTPTTAAAADITTCTGGLVGTTYTLTADCATTEPLTIPSTITTLDGGGFTISATDAGGPQWNGAIVTNATAGQTMNIQNVTITGPDDGFQLCTLSGNVLYGIFFNDASGSVSNVTVDHIFQFQNFAFGSCQTGRAIRADALTAAHTVTITDTVVTDYQKSGFEARGSTTTPMTMNLSGSTAGPPRPLNGFSAQNAVSYVGASGTIADNTIIGSGDQGPGLGRGNGTAVLLSGANNVTVDSNTITGAQTNIGVSVSAGSTNITISFNEIGRTAPDAPPDDPGIGIAVDPGLSATLICNTFSGWITNIVGAVQISCEPLPPGTECETYSADVLSVEGGTGPFTWSVTEGALPPGLSMAPESGAITGTPTTAGEYNFTVQVADSSEPSLTATQPHTITIAPGCVTTTTTPPTTTPPTTAPPTTTPPTTAPPTTTPPPANVAELRVTKVVDRTAVTVDPSSTAMTRLTYTIEVTNEGPGTATDVVVTDTLPGGVVPVSAVPTVGTCTRDGATLTCLLGTIAIGATETITVTIDLLPTQPVGTVANRVGVDSLSEDPDPTNNAAEALTQVNRPSAALPATGNRDVAAPVTIATVLLLVGTGMFGVARWRRRSVG